MIEFIIATYGTICWLVFKKFKLVAVTTYSVVTAFLIGVFMIGFILIMMNMYQPVSKDGRILAYTTAIVPQVKGRVTEVPVQPNVSLKKGDVLFRIDPTPYQNKFDALEARLNLAQTRLGQEQRLLSQGAGQQYEVERYQADVDGLSAQLADAQFNLEQTTVTAPTDGFVTQLMLRPGVMAVPLPLAPVMVFVHSDEPVFAATFKQNALQGIDEGDEAEIAFPAIPGRVFKGHVTRVLPILGEGQLQASGKLLQFTMPQRPGRVPVVIEIEDDLSEYNLPIGSAASVAIYTGEFHVTNIVRRIILRMKSWENYLFID
jgi:multidrug resistance efflux pump